MKKNVKYVIVMILTVILMSNGLGVSAQERYSEENIYYFLEKNGLLNGEAADVAYVQMGDQYAIQTLQELGENQYESTVTVGYMITEDGELVRSDVLPLSDITGTHNEKGIYITTRMSYSLYRRYYNTSPYNIAYISPYALSVTITGPSDLTISYMNARLMASADTYPFPDCLNWGASTDTTQYILDNNGYHLEFSRSNLTPGVAYGATQFMPSNKILGISNYGVEHLLIADIAVETNKGNIPVSEIDFGYPLELPGT